MSEGFNLEIVNPEKSFLIKENVSEVVVPAFEGEMGILKDHISIISFLKPGIIKIQNKKGDFENFFVQDGTVEFFNDALVILSSSAINIKDLSKEFIEKLHKKTEAELADKNITDHDRYVLNHKLDAIKEIRV